MPQFTAAEIEYVQNASNITYGQAVARMLARQNLGHRCPCCDRKKCAADCPRGEAADEAKVVPVLVAAQSIDECSASAVAVAAIEEVLAEQEPAPAKTDAEVEAAKDGANEPAFVAADNPAPPWEEPSAFDLKVVEKFLGC